MFRNSASSTGVGGTPVRSSVTRRSKVARSASADGVKPVCSSLARRKLSMGFRGHPTSDTTGGTGRSGGMNAQCG